MSYNLLLVGQSESSMSIIDEDLSFLATQAALELDMLMEKKDTDLEAILRLSNVMKGSFYSMQAGGQSSSLDPATATIVNRAFADSGSVNLETVDQLIERSLELADELASQTDPSRRNGELERMKRFCIALARCSAAYRESILGHRTKHPYRK